MKKITNYILFIFLVMVTSQLIAQEEYQLKVNLLKERKASIALQEKEALKQEVEAIAKRLKNGEITKVEADALKIKAAEKRALNIENRNAIIDNEVALLERNRGEVLVIDSLQTGSNWRGALSDLDVAEGFAKMIGVNLTPNLKDKQPKFDKRTYDDLVFAFGLNNTWAEGRSLNDSPYKIGGSRFFEIGWQWRTRVLKNSNFVRLNYGFSFQFNGLKINGDKYFVGTENAPTELVDFEVPLRKSKFRMDNLVFPVHLEFGPSSVKKSERTIRYSIKNQFRVGVGAFAGVNLTTRQKIKFTMDGENVTNKFKESFSTNDFIYGLSAYAGVDGVLLYMKYDLNPIFKYNPVEERNISLGLRFDL